jgi:hypothetical protein
MIPSIAIRVRVRGLETSGSVWRGLVASRRGGLHGRPVGAQRLSNLHRAITNASRISSVVCCGVSVVATPSTANRPQARKPNAVISAVSGQMAIAVRKGVCVRVSRFASTCEMSEGGGKRNN